MSSLNAATVSLTLTPERSPVKTKDTEPAKIMSPIVCSQSGQGQCLNSGHLPFPSPKMVVFARSLKTQVLQTHVSMIKKKFLQTVIRVK